MQINEFETRMTEVLGMMRWKSAFARAVGRKAEVFRRWGEVPEWAVAILEFLEATPRHRWPDRFEHFKTRRIRSKS